MSQVRKPEPAHHVQLPKMPFHHSHHSPSSSVSSDARPIAPNRQNSFQTKYMAMLLALDDIPRLHNILVAFFTVEYPQLTIEEVEANTVQSGFY